MAKKTKKTATTPAADQVNQPVQTQNESWGFWGTMSMREIGSVAVARSWDAAIESLLAHLPISREQAREILDSRFGRHLADQIADARNTRNQVGQLIGLGGWRREALAAIGIVEPKAPTLPKGPGVVAEIARKHLGIETLETRNSDSLDFHDVSVAGLRAALEAAYEAGRNAGKKG